MNRNPLPEAVDVGMVPTSTCNGQYHHSDDIYDTVILQITVYIAFVVAFVAQ